MKIKILIAVFIFCSLLLVIGGSSVISKAADGEGDLPSATSPPVNLPLVVNNFGGDFWSLSGNAGTNPGEHFLGTIDDKEVQIKTKNIIRMTVGANGNVAIGLPSDQTPQAKLDVNGTANISENILAKSLFMGAIWQNNYLPNEVVGYRLQVETDGEGRGIQILTPDFIYLESGSALNLGPSGPTGGGPGSYLQAFADGKSKKAELKLNPQGGNVSVPVLLITGGSDLAEPFLIHAQDEVLPGMVVAIDPEHPGDLRLAGQAYDSTVAGCLSGAGELEPGLVLQGEALADTEALPVALTGRVYCWADASEAPIQPGDLLTTSSRPGYAMKAADPAQAWGAILGKAMTALEDGQGLVLVLVSLQ